MIRVHTAEGPHTYEEATGWRINEIGGLKIVAPSENAAPDQYGSPFQAIAYYAPGSFLRVNRVEPAMSDQQKAESYKQAWHDGRLEGIRQAKEKQEDIERMRMSLHPPEGQG